MNNYFDEFGRVHHKPVTEANPYPSGNGWIYTAFLKKVGALLDMKKLAECFQLCVQKVNSRIALIRSPGYVGSPFSHDEVLGAVELELLKPEHLNGWSFCPYEIPKFNAIKLVQQLWQLRPTFIKAEEVELHKFFQSEIVTVIGLNFVLKHRNYFWQNNLDQLYRFEFKCRLKDRHYILKKWNKFKFYNPVHLFYAGIAKLDSMFGKASGIRFVKYGGEKNKAEMVKEFTQDNPIVQQAGL